MQVTNVGQIQNQTALLVRLRTASSWLCSGIMLTALFTLAGWQFDWAFFKRPIPGLVAMHPLTALCFIAASGSLLLYINAKALRLGQLTALMPLGVGGLMLIKRATGLGPNLQTLLFAQKLKADAVGNVSNLMAPNTAFCFLLVGASLVYLHTYRKSNPIPAQWLVLLVWVVTLITLLGYAYQVQAFYGALASYPMAIHTALCFLLLALALLLTTADQGFMREVFIRWAGKLPGQSLIGIAVVVPFVLGFLVLTGYWSGTLSTELALALFVVSLTLIFLGLIWRNIRLLNRKEEQEQQILLTLRQQEEHIQTLFRAAPDAILVFDEHGQLATWNTQALHLLGVARGNSLAGRRVDSLIVPASEAIFRQEWQSLIAGDDQLTSRSFDLTAKRDDQTEFEAAFSISHTTVQGKPLFISFVRDVTLQRAATQQLKQANADLLRSNENLQQFTYVASHDLQEPLRKVQQFGDLLIKSYTPQLAEGVRYVERMQSAAGRMSLLIKDLLAFSRITTNQVPMLPIVLPEVIDHALENLAVVVDETKAQILVGTLPTVQGDATQLEQLFQNLLANAIKFSRTNQAGSQITPRITIRANRVLAKDMPAALEPTRQAVAYHRIEVADNGVGFDDKYTDRIFQVFQRLHNKNDFAGTGVGLAICQKVVANHGGAITATSQLGQGATFSVYLPA